MSGFVTIEPPLSKEGMALRLECVRLAADLCQRKGYMERLDCPRHAAVIVHIARELSDFVFGKNDAEIIRAAHDLAKKITS